MKLKLRMLFCFLIALVLSLDSYGEDSIDLSEKLVKIKNIVAFKFGSQGFGFYDYGAKSFKIFDWKFNIVNEVPLIRGEGPAEIKNDVATACLYKDQLLIIPMNQKKIMIFFKKGQFIRDLKLDISPRQVLNLNTDVCILNGRINLSDELPLVAKIINPVSGLTLKEIRFKKKLEGSKNKDDIWLSGLMTFFDIDESNNIYIFRGFEHSIYEIDESGKCTWEITLPYIYREKRWQVQVNGEMEDYISSLDFYIDFKIVKNAAFVCFYKTIKKGMTSNEDIYQTYVIRVLKNGKQSRKEFNGTYCILGENNGNLYLFNHDDYKVLPVKLGEWD